MKTPDENLKISLEILERNNPFKSESGGAVYFTSHILDAMKEYGDLRHNAAVDACVESARAIKVTCQENGTPIREEYAYNAVDKQSILKNKL